MLEKSRAPRNRTITLNKDDRKHLRKRLKSSAKAQENYVDVTILGDCLEVAPYIAKNSVDMLFLDPPYNLNKRFGDRSFTKGPVKQYTEWLGGILDALLPAVKPNGTVYICSDWYTSTSVFVAASERLNVINRITWEREKGRGAKNNWKNSCEDIWFCVTGKDYTFNIDQVKVRRKVIAPYRNGNGTPKDWQENDDGNYRDTHPSNLWADITIPFWSMPENTDHPTQKSEKLIAKLMLASTNPEDLVLDPFLGSGTTSVVAKKLGRHFIGVELEEEYALLAEKRLEIATADTGIQGYSDGIFWERNSLAAMNGRSKKINKSNDDLCLLI
ncbi:MAG: site-specific DNA-methyltransferase [Rhodospirillales bacterium]|nr:site-specific DNA-methyltransferase [Rhodospirillales bacterium]